MNIYNIIRDYLKIKLLPILFILQIFQIVGCENNEFKTETHIDPQVIFSSRRWWNYDIFISNVYGGNITQLTKNKWIDFNPVISHDYKKLAFISDRNGNREIYVTDLEWLDGFAQWRANNLRNITN